MGELNPYDIISQLSGQAKHLIEMNQLLKQELKKAQDQLTAKEFELSFTLVKMDVLKGSLERAFKAGSALGCGDGCDGQRFKAWLKEQGLE